MSRNEKLQRIFYMYICCICYWFYLRRNDVQIIRQVSRMDRKEAIEYAKFRLECHTKGDGEYTDYGEFLVAAIEALQEKAHRCDNCSNGENAGVRIYCLLHTSFHRLDEYCSEWRQE